MGAVEDRRKLIKDEMEAGRGSNNVLDHPVTLGPPFKPFSLRRERQPFLERLLAGVKETPPASPGKANSTAKLSFIRIKPSREDKNSLETVEQCILSLPASSPTSFEIEGHNGLISFQLVVEESTSSAVTSQLGAHFPSADVYAGRDPIEGALPPGALARAYRLRNSHFFMLNPVSDGDPYRTLFGYLGDLEPGQLAVLQVLFMPIQHDWPDNMRRASRSPYDPSQSPFVDLPKLPQVVDKKLAKPLYATSLRMIASDEKLLVTMEGFLRQFENVDTGIIPVHGAYPIESIVKRNTFVHGFILNSTELSYLLHLPVPELIVSMSCIERAVKSYPVPAEFTTDGPILGYNRHRGIKKAVRHSAELPNQHVYVPGKSGYGKTNLILCVVVQRINRGDGLAVIDPHGALVKDVLSRIPKERIKDVIYLNAGDFEHPMAINPLAHGGTKLEKEHIRVDLLNFFEDLFEAPLGVNIQHALNFFIVSLLTRRDSTLGDIERLLLNKDWRNTLVQSIDDDRVRMFWEHEFPQLEKRGIVTAITNKLSPLILPDSAIAPMLVQRENRLDFLKIMDEKKILLCNLSHGDIGKRNSQLLGKLLVSKLQIAAMMREGNGTGPDFYVYIDEFQHMVCPSMADILSGARKYGLHLWLTNQMIGDIPDYILRHVFNASTLIFFATDSPSDQALIEKNLSKKFKAEDVGQLKRGETYVKMVANVFNMTTERVTETPHVNYAKEIIAASRARYMAANAAAVKESDGKVKAGRQKDVMVSKNLTLLSPQERSFLEGVFNNPVLHIRALYKALGLSGYMGDKLKSAVKEKGLISEVTTSRLAKFIVLTPHGFEALNIEFGPDTGKGGPLHRYWQSVIRFHAEAKGYQAVIEDSIPGGKETVDVGLEKDDLRIAIEVSITTKAEHEVGNVRKCLKAGYSQVITLFLEEAKLVQFKTLIEQALIAEERKRVLSGPLTAFCQIL